MDEIEKAAERGDRPAKKAKRFLKAKRSDKKDNKK